MNSSKIFQRSQLSFPPNHSHTPKFFTIYVMQSAQVPLALLRRLTTCAILAEGRNVSGMESGIAARSAPMGKGRVAGLSKRLTAYNKYTRDHF